MGRDTAVALSLGLVAGAVLGSVIGTTLANKKTPTCAERVEGFKKWRMSKWVKHNGILRTQGLVGNGPLGTTAQQTTEALAKLDAILKEAGVPRKNLLAVRIYVSKYTEENLKEMNDVYDKWVDPDGLPTRICVQAGIGNFAIEIQAEAFYEE